MGKHFEGLQYEFFQFKNFYDQIRTSWQAWNSLIEDTGLGYDMDVKTFTLDDARWEEMIKVNWLVSLIVCRLRFGVLKDCFPILKRMPLYSSQTQALVVVAAFTLHNYSKQEAWRDW